MGHDVFVIYASTDRATAQRLHDELTTRGMNTFLDARNLGAGMPWDDAIEAALRGSLLQVVLLGREARWYQRDEVQTAIAEMRKLHAEDRVVPVLLAPDAKVPYGLSHVEPIRWEGAERAAAAIAAKVHALRGGTRDASGGARRVKVGVFGAWDEQRALLDALVRRIEQMEALLDGPVRRVELASTDEPRLDLRVVVVGARHGGRLDLLSRLVDAALDEQSSGGAHVPGTLAGLAQVALDDIPEEREAEATAVRRLRRRLPRHEGDMVDELHDAVRRWYATAFPALPGRSVTREPWEDRYLKDSATLWRRGNAGAMRGLGQTAAERASWYVHLRAATPWVEVAGEVRCEVGIQFIVFSREVFGREGLLGLRDQLVADRPARPRGRPVHTYRDRSDRAALEPGPSGVPTSVLFARTTSTPGSDWEISETDKPAFRNGDVAPGPTWLDAVLSHDQLPRTVVSGPAGTGKSALLQHIAWVLASGVDPGDGPEPIHRIDRAGVRGRSPIAPIPVLHSATTLCAHLRNGGGFRPIREALVSLLQSSDTFGADAPIGPIRAGLDEGRYVILIDSLDEVPSQRDREALVAALGALDGPAPRVVLTTRPGAHTHVELPSGFAPVTIAPLDEERSEALLVRWLQSWAPKEDVERARNAVQTVRRDFPTSTDGSSPVENPLLLSCVLYVFATYHRLPDDTAKLYSDMIRILCESRVAEGDDRTRDSRVEVYREALRLLFVNAQERGGTSLPLRTAHDLLVDRKLASRDGVENWLQRLANHTGLLRFEGSRADAVIRPWHRSFQEYLAAESIAAERVQDPKNCVAWLREDRAEFGPRLLDATWRGCLRFLVGASLHYRRESGVGLIKALRGATTDERPDAASLYALATRAVAEYAPTFLQHESVRTSVPEQAAQAFERHGAEWPLGPRLEVLHSLGVVGDPRLPDPRTVDEHTARTGWIWIPPGQYPVGARMGDQVLPPGVCSSPGFWIRRWPVTFAEFLHYEESEGRLKDRRALHDASLRRTSRVSPNCPVPFVTWHEARDFCRWAQVHWRTPVGRLDLPTSLEWEIAARGTSGRTYAWGDDDPGVEDTARAAYRWNRHTDLVDAPTAVGAFPLGHTPEGIWDLCGNVFELTSSQKQEPEDVDVGEDDSPLATHGEMVYRGGCFFRDKNALLAARRGDQGLDRSAIWTGFRVVCRIGPTALVGPRSPVDSERVPNSSRKSPSRPARKRR